jgi:hypothetical protein
MRDKADAVNGEIVLGWQGPLALPSEKHLKAPLIVIARNFGHANTRAVERRYGHLSVSYVGDESRHTRPWFFGPQVFEDGPATTIAGVR